MRRQTTALGGRRLRRFSFVLVWICAAWNVHAQTLDEHSQHHPAQMDDEGRAQSGAPSHGSDQSSGDGMRMMGCGAQGCMNVPGQLELYPSLMSLPDLSPAQRADVEQRAHDRMVGGADQLSLALKDVGGAVERQDFAAMQEATDRMREALAIFESGLAGHRAIAEGQAPRGVALTWFKREMNLADPVEGPQPHGFVGLSSVHYASMLLLAGFGVLVTWMYVARSRRVSALLRSLSTPDLVATARPINNPAAAAVAPSDSSAAILPVERAPASVTGSWAGKLRVARIFEETQDVRTYRLAPVEDAALPFMFEPGQFLTIGAVIGGKTFKRSYSIASSPCCHGWCDITVKHAPGGAVSGYLHQSVKAGDHLDVSGPYGRFTFRGHEATSVVMIAGGVGITPLMSSIRYLTDQSWDGRIDLVYACTRLETIIFREELSYLEKRHPNLHVTTVLSDESSTAWNGVRGYVTAGLLEKIPQIRSRRTHLCGPPTMMDAVKKALSEIGVSDELVHTELFLSPAQPASPVVHGEPDQSQAATCTFAKSRKEVTLRPGETVLECAERNAVSIEYACRQGYCGVCKVKLVSGSVQMDVVDGLTAADKSSGLILACQAKATVPITVDA